MRTLGEELRAMNDETRRHMRVLHEDMVARFTLLDEGLNGRLRRSGRARKKKPH
jgi:hypothetical protein